MLDTEVIRAGTTPTQEEIDKRPFAHWWSDEQDNALRQLMSDGVPRARIADMMNIRFPLHRFTKNSVIGRIHRLGLSMTLEERQEELSRRMEKRMLGIAKKKRQAKAEKAKAALPPPPVVAEAPKPEVVKFKEEARPRRSSHFVGQGLRELVELQRSDCRWPLELNKKITFCGCRALSGRPYCARHAAIAMRRPA